MKQQIFALFRTLEQESDKEIWMWIYTCLKRWYYLFEHNCPDYLAGLPEDALRTHAIQTAEGVRGILRQHYLADSADYVAAHQQTEKALEDMLDELTAKIV